MAEPNSCPSLNQLRDFALGIASEAEASPIVDHLDVCAACEDAVDTLELAADTVISAILRPKVEDPYAEEPGCRRVEALVREIGRVPADLLPTLVLPSNAPFADPPPLGRFAGYELLEEIARGGMGVVYKAPQLSPERVVALKMILVGQLADDRAIRRFHAEADAAAHLEHPHIVPIYEAGEYKGQHFYSMGYVEGRSLSARVAEGPLPPREAAPLVKTIAEAVAYAHSRGVIHRDLKPANVLLDGSGRPRITDFGLARKTESDSSLTGTGQVLGTPSYMPPEQAGGETEKIGPLSDVYSLGALLYCLLTGRPPFQAATTIETLIQVLDKEPVSPRQLNPGLDRDLETICLKCLEKEPSRRYAGAAEMAADLARWVDRKPIHARPLGRVSRGWRWCKRNRLTASLVFAIATLLTLSAIGGTTLAVLANRSAQRAEEEKRNAELSEAEAIRQLYVSRMHLVQRAWDDKNMGRTLEMLEALTPEQTEGADLRGWEWYYRWRLCHSELRKLPVRATSPVFTTSLAFSPDGMFLLAGRDDGKLTIWNSDATEMAREFQAHEKRVSRLAFSRDGRQFATSSLDRKVKLWETETGQLLGTFTGSSGLYYGMALSPDGRRLAVGGDPLSIWDTANKKLMHQFPEVRFVALAFSPDGARLAHGETTGVLSIRDVRTGEKIRTFAERQSAVRSVCFRPDGKVIVSGREDGTIGMRDVETGGESTKFSGHARAIVGLAFNSEGTRLFSGSADSTVKIWDVATGGEVESLVCHAQGLSAVTVSPLQNVVATAGWDYAVCLWDAASSQRPKVLRPAKAQPNDRSIVNITKVAYSPDGKSLAGIGPKWLAVWDAGSGMKVWLKFIRGTERPNSHSLAFDPSSQMLASAGSDGKTHLWNVRDGRLLKTFAEPGVAAPVYSLDISPDGQILATGAATGAITFWSFPNGHRLGMLDAHKGAVLNVVFSPDGTRLASSGDNADPVLKLWDTAAMQEICSITGHVRAVGAIEFSRDGGQIVYGVDATLRWWDVEEGLLVRTQAASSSGIQGLAISRDGTRIATASDDGTLKIWDNESGQEVQTLEAGAGQLFCVASSPDDTQYATGTHLGEVLIWDARPLTPELRMTLNAVDLVESLYDRDLLPEEVIDQLNADRTLSKPVRSRAVELAQLRIAESGKLNWRAFHLVQQPGLSAEAYQKALRWVTPVSEREPQEDVWLTPLGAAQYRLGEYDRAADTLARARARHERNAGTTYPPDVAFLAMVHHRLGHGERASELLEELRRLVESDREKAVPVNRALLMEANDLISPAVDAPVKAPRPAPSPGTPVRWKLFDYGQGRFVQHDGGWREYQGGQLAFSFQEVDRTDTCIDIYDASRDMTVRIYADKCYLKGPRTKFNLLYQGRAE